MSKAYMPQMSIQNFHRMVTENRQKFSVTCCPNCGEYEFWYNKHCSTCGFDLSNREEKE